MEIMVDRIFVLDLYWRYLFQIYAVSKRYEMHVLEIASNEKRNGLQLKCKLQGATHSHKVFSTLITLFGLFIDFCL